jgi:catechol 2,3-dioxygenase-like lactoylglutathione lyase family enzyme
MIERIDHCEITVRDLDSSVKFYVETFGLHLKGKSEQIITQEGDFKGIEMKLAFLEGNGITFELIEYIKPKGEEKKFNPWDIGVQHIAFEVKNLEEIYSRLKEKGVNFLSPPIKHKTQDFDVTWTYLKDPNGSLLELLEFHEKGEVHRHS